MDRTFQLYICKTSTSAASRNQRMAKNHDPRILNSGDTWLIPTEIKVYSKTMVCTHAGVRQSRGKGIRPKQSNRAMGCPARMNVLTKRIPGRDNSRASGWKVLVTQHTAMHNHPLDAETYMSYPRNRRVEDPVVLEAVNALRTAGVKQGKIRKYIAEKEPTKHVTRSDVNNLLRKMKDDNFMANMQRAMQSGLPNAASTPTVAGEEAERGLTGTERPLESEGGPVGAAESAKDCAASAVASAAQGDIASAAPAVDRASQGGVPEPVAATRRVKESVSFVEPATANFTLRRRNKARQRSPAVAQRNENGENNATSLQELCDSEEVSSGSFKLRVQRLEEQNVALFRKNAKLVEQNQQYAVDLGGVRTQNAALYAQNTKLAEQNRQYVADVAEAQKTASDSQRQVIALRASGIKMREAVSALTQEVALLRAEKAKWKQQDQDENHTITSDSTEAQDACGGHPGVEGQADGSQEEPVRMPKRALESSESNSDLELVRPQKRASTQAKCTPGAP